jgi:hypothetical protein
MRSLARRRSLVRTPAKNVTTLFSSDNYVGFNDQTRKRRVSISYLVIL